MPDEATLIAREQADLLEAMGAAHAKWEAAVDAAHAEPATPELWDAASAARAEAVDLVARYHDAKLRGKALARRTAPAAKE